MPGSDSLSKLLQQIELAPRDTNILNGCAEAAITANLSDFDPVITVRPFLFHEQLKAIVTEREFDDMKEETNNFKKMLEVEKEQLNFIKELIDIEKAKCANEKNLFKQSKDIDGKLKQYGKEINIIGYGKPGAVDSLKAIISALDQINEHDDQK